jgi:phosphosulfolactate synthase
MNFSLPDLPERPIKPRKSGLTMVMDKGLSLGEAENMVSAAHQLIDFVKLGFGTSLITNKLEEKISVYHAAGIRVYLGGTLFEAFVERNLIDDYLRLVDRLKLQTVEISDGCITIGHDEKLSFIHRISQNFQVLSEVGSKDADVHFSPQAWVNMMKNELQAGSFKVIAEARESGNVGIYNSSGKAETDIIDSISGNIEPDKIIWEAPQKAQQVWFIKKFGANVNLGNIASNEIIALETLRLGLRGDTFHDFLPPFK